MRTGRANTAHGAKRFVEELAGRLRRHHIRYSVTVRQTTQVQQAITAIAEAAWTRIEYPDGGVAEFAETTLGGDRLVVRRTRLVGTQATLWPDWRYHALVTDREGTPVQLDADHRRDAVMELAIRDLKHGARLRHCPSGRFLYGARPTNGARGLTAPGVSGAEEHMFRPQMQASAVQATNGCGRVGLDRTGDRQPRLDLFGGLDLLGGPPQLDAAAVGGEPGDPALGDPDV
jgi:hypothetical protein